MQRKIDSKTKSFNREVEDAQAEARSEQQKLVNESGQKMMQVIDKYAQARRATCGDPGREQPEHAGACTRRTPSTSPRK